MKTTIITALSCLLAITSFAETHQEAMDAAYEWVEREAERQEARASRIQQQSDMDEIRWELAERRRQAAENSAAREAQDRAQQAAMRRIAEQQQRAIDMEMARRRQAR